MSEEGMSRIEAAKKGIGEIAFPIIISTATTVAAFIPLGLWPGIMGEFMKILPITLSIVLGSSLFVAIFFNSVRCERRRSAWIIIPEGLEVGPSQLRNA